MSETIPSGWRVDLAQQIPFRVVIRIIGEFVLIDLPHRHGKPYSLLSFYGYFRLDRFRYPFQLFYAFVLYTAEQLTTLPLKNLHHLTFDTLFWRISLPISFLRSIERRNVNLKTIANVDLDDGDIFEALPERTLKRLEFSVNSIAALQVGKLNRCSRLRFIDISSPAAAGEAWLDRELDRKKATRAAGAEFIAPPKISGLTELRVIRIEGSYEIFRRFDLESLRSVWFVSFFGMPDLDTPEFAEFLVSYDGWHRISRIEFCQCVLSDEVAQIRRVIEHVSSVRLLVFRLMPEQRIDRDGEYLALGESKKKTVKIY